MRTRCIQIDKDNCIPCYLSSTIFSHINESDLEIITHSGNDSEYFSINNDDAREIIIMIVEHFKKRCLEDNELNIIYNLIK